VTTQLWLGLGLLLGAACLVASLAVGIFGFSPERAKAIRSAEADDPLVVEEIRRIHVAAPDRFRRGRIDRHPAYIAIHTAALGYSVSILSGAAPTSNLLSLNPGTMFTMASCFLIGSVLSLLGSAMGLHLWRWDIVPGVSEHIASSRLGDDIRLPYMFGLIGMFTASISLGIYASTSFKSTLGSWGGWSAMCIAVACACMVVVYYHRIRQYTRTLKVVVNTAVASVISRGSHVD
jgi:hypothetical protein